MHPYILLLIGAMLVSYVFGTMHVEHNLAEDCETKQRVVLEHQTFSCTLANKTLEAEQ